jgi:hypothetical protein
LRIWVWIGCRTSAYLIQPPLDNEKSFGPDHPNVAISLNNLAELLSDRHCPRSMATKSWQWLEK